MLIAILLFIFIVGLCIGSFLNVVILRALQSESIVSPASKCPKCGNKLFWWHNIPLLSYIILRGKCGFCKEKISLQYPIVEFLTGVIFVLAFLKYGITWDTIFAWIIGSLLVVIAGTDWREKVVFDLHTYLLIAVGILYALIVTGVEVFLSYKLLGTLTISSKWLLTNPITNTLFGIILGYVILEGAARLGYLFAGTRAFGEGDSLIAAGLGAVFGWKTLLYVLVLSLIVQAVITVPVFIKKEISNKNWMTVISLAAFLVYTAAFIMALNFGWLSNKIAYGASAIVLAVIGIFTCREILLGIKNPDNRTYLPFGPALVLAGLIILLL